MKSQNKKVIIGLSGGLDSTMAAAKLKKEGYAVIGVFLLLWKSKKEIAEVNKKAAREVAEKLGIEFRVVSAGKIFRETVVAYFLRAYSRGKTPNPCVLCNEKLKFKLLFEEAKKSNAGWVATGHYARIKCERQKSKITSRLFSAQDKKKDQSYFLYRLKQKELAKIIFPLGDYKKEEIRLKARKMSLPVWNKKESQDVCFLAGTNVADFLKKNLKMKAGDIIDEKNRKIGTHSGLPLYTYGQRKGLAVGGRGPYYVASKNSRTNQLQVTNRTEGLSLFSKVAKVEKVSWTAGKPPKSLSFLARVRYQGSLVPAKLKARTTRHISRVFWEVEFTKPQKALASGQSIVFYSTQGEVLGGGIIK